MNPFKVGDIVVCTDNGRFERLKTFNTYTVTNAVDDMIYVVDESGEVGGYWPFRFKLKEETGNMNNDQQVTQKTKRVPFTHELWEKWKEKGGKVFFKPEGKQVLQLAYFPEADHRYRYLYLTTPGSCVAGTDAEYLSIEIPVTTKRIPFNPELKNAKVFYGDTELIEWFQAKTGVVCGTHVVNNFGGEDTSLYHPNDLKMEIEED